MDLCRWPTVILSVGLIVLRPHYLAPDRSLPSSSSQKSSSPEKRPQRYVIVSVRYEQPLGTLRLRVGIDNLFDTRFESLRGFPRPGRTLFMQVTGDF